ncbi:MAG TPA: AAA family ATPase [Stellaceae bacterium]|jgi:pilus assembly protein CpaE|nr:AAA family ATPase [Stellaceae bacterium]
MAAAVERSAGAARKPNRAGVVAIVHDQATLDRIQGVIRELQLDDELSFEATLDAALRRIHEGANPRVLVIDLSESPAPISELSSARAVGGDELKILALGTVNDVGLYRDMIAAGATDYLVKPPGREQLNAVLEKNASGSGTGGLGQVIAFIGSRGGVGTTTAAVSCAWIFAEERKERAALIDLDLHYGTVALKLDSDPGNGLCEALEQPSRIDSLFIERAMIKVSENLRILAAEAALAEPQVVDAGAIDVLLYELRRKFAWVIVDLPRYVTPVHRVVLSTASRAILLCERSLAGLRDTIRLQTLLREQAPQTRLFLVESGAHGDRATVGKGEFEKAVGKSFDATLSYDPKGAGAAANAGQPLPMAAPRSAYSKEIHQFVLNFAGAAAEAKKRRFGGINLPW